MNMINTVQNIDCLIGMQAIPDGSIDMILCDLPYGEVNRDTGGLRNLNKGLADVCNIDLHTLVEQYGRVCKGTVYLFCGIEQISVLTKELKLNGFSTRLGQWEKSNPSPMNGTKVWLSASEFCVIGRKPNAVFNRHCEKPIWKYPVGTNKLHPTQKPLKLFEYLIESSTNEYETVLDNCMGSGTTAIACINTNRNYIGFEKEEKYFNIIQERIKNHLQGKQYPVETKNIPDGSTKSQQDLFDLL
jgi:DNA modification methylase